jgi:hypothetical protein
MSDLSENLNQKYNNQKTQERLMLTRTIDLSNIGMTLTMTAKRENPENPEETTIILDDQTLQSILDDCFETKILNQLQRFSSIDQNLPKQETITVDVQIVRNPPVLGDPDLHGNKGRHSRKMRKTKKQKKQSSKKNTRTRTRTRTRTAS